MTTLMNRQYYLASRPAGAPDSSNVPARDVPVPEPADGEVVLKNLYISLDPAIRLIRSSVYGNPFYLLIIYQLKKEQLFYL